MKKRTDFHEIDVNNMIFKRRGGYLNRAKKLTRDQKNEISLILSGGYVSIDDYEAKHLNKWLSKNAGLINYDDFVETIELNIEKIHDAEKNPSIIYEDILDAILSAHLGEKAYIRVKQKRDLKKEFEQAAGIHPDKLGLSKYSIIPTPVGIEIYSDDGNNIKILDRLRKLSKKYNFKFQQVGEDRLEIKAKRVKKI